MTRRALLSGLVLGLILVFSASAATASTSRYGGTLVVGITRGEPGSLNPVRSTLFGAVVAYRTFCQKLYDTDARAHVVPQLAAALPTVSKDKRTYTIPLRRGVRFNDNTPFDAQAVATSLDLLRGASSQRASDLEAVESVTAAGPYTIVLHLRQPFAPLLENLATPAGTVLSPTQLDKVGFDGFARDPVCVGPFMYDHRVAGDSLTVIKSPYYFDRGRVYLDKIVFKYLPAAAAAAALKAGDVQVVDSISSTELEAVQKRSNLRTIERAAFGYVSIEFNIGARNGMGNPPYSNIGTPWSRSPLLRQAFEEAIDRKKLAQVVYLGAVQPGCTPVAPASPWFDAGIPCTRYDPADARKLVAASGMPSPTLHLHIGDDTEDRRLAQFIQAAEEAVGIDVVIDTEPSGSGVATGRYEANIGGWAGGIDPDRNLYLFLATAGSRNRVGYSNQRFDLILENGRKATSEQARRTLYRVAQRILLADRPMIYLYHPIHYAGIDRSRVSGVEFFPDTQIRVIHAQLR